MSTDAHLCCSAGRSPTFSRVCHGSGWSIQQGVPSASAMASPPVLAALIAAGSQHQLQEQDQLLVEARDDMPCAQLRENPLRMIFSIDML
jgi:hypothetical protein